MKLIMTKGLPGSGKTTWAKDRVDHKRINKDDLRKMLDRGKWSKNNEKFVLAVRDQIIFMALTEGNNVIVDDTNLAPKHEERLKQLAKQQNAEFIIKDFTDVPIETCIKQDLLRFDSVGESVIRKMHDQFLAPKYDPPVYDPALPNVVLCDMDGTLASFPGKNPFNRDFENDIVHEPVKSVVNLAATLNQVIILSARENRYQDVTEQWLRDNEIFYNNIFMRKSGDTRNDAIVKEEIYRREIEGKYNVSFVLDDRNRVVDLWRRLGLVCFQVAEGAF